MSVWEFWRNLFRRPSAPVPQAPAVVVPPSPLISFRMMRAAAPEASPAMIDRYLVPLNDAAQEYAIDTPERVAAFLAQIAHETGGFRWTREFADGRAYEFRADLGNSEPGDGPRFKGRGLIQLTGRGNYRLASRALFGDDRLLMAPDLAERPDISARVAAWFWTLRGLNTFADLGSFAEITRRINGGLNGHADRVARWERTKAESRIA